MAFPKHFLDIIKKSGVGHRELSRLLGWPPRRLEGLLYAPDRRRMDCKEFKQMSAWVASEEARQNIKEGVAVQQLTGQVQKPVAA